MKRRSMYSELSWKERDFEQWFIKNPILPSRERLFVVRQESAIQRVADLVCLDRKGGLVILEIKNEPTPRSIIGQALEYLSQFEGVTADVLAEDFPGGLLEFYRSFKRLFKTSLRGISNYRRILLVAPKFDPHSCHGIEFLNRKFAAYKIQFSLLQATRTSDGFILQNVEPTPLVHSSQMVGQWGCTPYGRLVYVLEGGRPQILWHLGKWKDGQLRFSQADAVTRRGLRFGTRLLGPQAFDAIDFAWRDSSWDWHKPGTHRWAAKVIGIVDAEACGAGKGKHVFYAMRNGDRWGYRRRELSLFEKRWKRSNETLPSWSEIVSSGLTIRDQVHSP
ncbi:MAG: hypothetical protein SFU85_02245 [Candidatus Methylacidiphilales bacterium]|nr:hypothetical protein [Candidatus Methylacidiphilales bacterium]